MNASSKTSAPEKKGAGPGRLEARGPRQHLRAALGSGAEELFLCGGPIEKTRHREILTFSKSAARVLRFTIYLLKNIFVFAKKLDNFYLKRATSLLFHTAV